uniref:Uncharacterized protein n=1 Tax=Oryza punctata TaxID=4537 RepID=A0A0E0MER4_ORYPU
MFSAVVKPTNPRKYFMQHACHILLHGARAMSQANSMDNAGSSRPQLSVTTEEAIFTVVKDLGTDLRNSPSEIVGYSGVKVVSLE